MYAESSPQSHPGDPPPKPPSFPESWFPSLQNGVLTLPGGPKEKSRRESSEHAAPIGVTGPSTGLGSGGGLLTTQNGGQVQLEVAGSRDFPGLRGSYSAQDKAPPGSQEEFQAPCLCVTTWTKAKSLARQGPGFRGLFQLGLGLLGRGIGVTCVFSAPPPNTGDPEHLHLPQPTGTGRETTPVGGRLWLPEASFLALSWGPLAPPGPTVSSRNPIVQLSGQRTFLNSTEHGSPHPLISARLPDHPPHNFYTSLVPQLSGSR